MSLIVVYAKAMGHVLGALAPAGSAGTAPDVKDLVGDALPLQASDVTLHLPVDMLATAVVADQPGALAVPLAFGVQLAGGEPRGELTALQPVSNAAVPPLLPPDGLDAELGQDGVTITLPTPPSTDLAVQVVVGADGNVQQQAGQVRAGSRTATVGIDLGAGSYGVLALVAGWRGLVKQVTL